MALTDSAVRAAKPHAKARKLFDGGGLYLELSPAGGKWWRWKYRFGGKEKRLSLGVYPGGTLKSARERRDAVRQQLAAGIGPGQAHKAQKLAAAGGDSFEAIAREWHAKFSPGWVASHGDRILRRFENDLFPWLGQRPVADISAPELLSVLRRVESRGAVETAHRAMQNCGQVLRYAIATAVASPFAPRTFRFPVWPTRANVGDGRRPRPPRRRNPPHEPARHHASRPPRLTPRDGAADAPARPPGGRPWGPSSTPTFRTTRCASSGPSAPPAAASPISRPISGETCGPPR